MALIGNVSGSLTTTAAGKSYIRAGENITITSGSTESSEHFVTITASGGGGLSGLGSTDNALLRANGTGGNAAQGSSILVADNGNMSAVGTLGTTGGVTIASANGLVGLGAGGNEFSITESSDDITIQTLISNKDMIFKVNDGGSATEVFRLDGDVSALKIASGKELQFADSGEKISSNGSDLTVASGAKIVLDSETAIELDSASGDITFADGGTAQLAIDMDGTGGEVIMQLKVDGDDFVFKQRDGTEVIRFTDEGSVEVKDGFSAGVTMAAAPGNSVFFVSGAKSAQSSQQPDNTEGAHFGGDVVVSGSLFGSVGNFANGIGTNGDLNVANVVVAGNLVHSDDTDTKIEFADDKITFKAKDIVMLTMSGSDDNTVVFNEASDNNFVFRVESGNNDSAFEIDGADEKIGIGLSSDQYGQDTWLFVSGTIDLADRQQANGKYTVFGGGVVLSGSMVPGVDNSIDLGASTHRFANIYTADLNLRNDRGDWTLIEEEEFISFRNNATGKRYKMLMQEITGDGSYGPGNDGEM